MKSQPDAPYGKWIEDLRIPRIKGLPNDIVQMLHHTFVEIVWMRRSIEGANVRIAQSLKAILESREMLKRGF